MNFLANSIFIWKCVCVCVCVCAQSCLTLCNPMGCSPPSSTPQEISQARILKQTAISYLRGSSWSRDWTHLSCISCIGRQIIYHCTSWEDLYVEKHTLFYIFLKAFSVCNLYYDGIAHFLWMQYFLFIYNILLIIKSFSWNLIFSYT